MSEAIADDGAGRALRLDALGAAALRASDGLRYAAAPGFAVMALITGVEGGGAAHWVCSSAQEASPLTGMTAMYVLMSVIHAPPWLHEIFRRRLPSGGLPMGASVFTKSGEPASVRAAPEDGREGTRA
jgi:hypothetical protein